MVEVVLVLVFLAPLLLIALGRLKLLLGSPAFGVCLRNGVLAGSLRPPNDDGPRDEEWTATATKIRIGSTSGAYCEEAGTRSP